MNAAERRAEYVRRTVAEWPPLSDAQCARIAALLSPAATGPATGSQPGGRHG